MTLQNLVFFIIFYVVSTRITIIPFLVVGILICMKAHPKLEESTPLIWEVSNLDLSHITSRPPEGQCYILQLYPICRIANKSPSITDRQRP